MDSDDCMEAIRQYIDARKNYKPFESLGFGWLVVVKF